MSILSQIPSACTLRRDLKRIIFGSKVRCPRCTSTLIKKIKKEERWRCKKCRYPFSITSTTWLKGTKLSLETIWLLLWCWQKKLPIQQSSELVGVSIPTVYAWYGRFRDNIPKERIDTLVGGEIVCDEMFVKNNCIMGIKEKGSRKIMLEVLHKKDPTKLDAIEFLTRYAKVNSHLCTDGGGIYKGIDTYHRITHSYEIHSKFEFSLTAEIEGLWGVFRTFVRRMYHHVTNIKLEDIVREFCLRFSQDEVFDSPLRYFEICLSGKPFDL